MLLVLRPMMANCCQIQNCDNQWSANNYEYYPLELANYGRILIANTAVLACLVASTDEYQHVENEANTVG